MKCPHCKTETLVPSFIDSLFRGHTCNLCHGHWLLIEDYLNWLDQHKSHQFQQDPEFELDESKQALICPMTGAIMQKFRIDAESEHKLNYSHAVGGVWLDKGEWSLLKEKGYAGSLNKVFTLHWQKMIRENQTHAKFAKMYRTKFGNMDYERVRIFRHWLEHHPRKSELIAYLNAADPYSAER